MEATCVDDGYTGDTYCVDCGVMIQKGSVIAATGIHTPSTVWQTDGENHWQVCSVCGLELNKGTHTGGEATCTDKAVYEV